MEPNQDEKLNSQNQSLAFQNNPPDASLEGFPPNATPGIPPLNMPQYRDGQPGGQPYVQPFYQSPNNFQPQSNPLETQREAGFFKKHKRGFLIFLIFILVLAISGGAAWGYDKYETYGEKVVLEKVLPGDSDLVLKVSIDPESEQFKLLEKNMEKFPGYRQLRMSLDESGQAKSFSELFQNKLKEYNLDFQKDIKSVLGESAYVIIPDLNPMGKNLYSDDFLGSLDFKVIGKKMAEIQKSNPLFAFGDMKENGDVAGEDQEKEKTALAGYEDEPLYNTPYKREEKKIEKMDFIAASEIKDLKKAKEVIDRLKGNIKYEMAEESYKGYGVYKIKYKSAGSSSAGRGANPGDFFNHEYTFHSLVGKNWISSSSEAYIKKIIDRRSERHIFRSLFSGEIGSFLADDSEYQKVIRSLNNDSGESLVALYYNIDFKEFFKNCGSGFFCFREDEYIRYPENIVDGFSMKILDDGFNFSRYSNNFSANQYKNADLKNSLAAKIPQKIDNRWADVFYELNNYKDLYYNYKNNYLTDRGVQELNKAYSSLEEAIGYHPERDFIDIISGNLAFIMLSGKNMYPEGALVAEISDPEAMASSMKKLVEGIKKAGIKLCEARIKAYENQSQLVDMQSLPGTKARIAKSIKVAREMAEALENSNITETSLPEGKIYSYKLPMSNDPFELSISFPALSFDYSLENNQFFISTHYGAVESMLKEMKSGSSKKLADNDFYKTGTKFFYADVNSNLYLNSSGIWNTAEYYFEEMKKAQREAVKKQCQESKKNQETAMILADYCDETAIEERWKKSEDQFFAIGAVVRTLQVLAFASTLGQDNSQSTFYMYIQEISQDEKERANRIFDGM